MLLAALVLSLAIGVAAQAHAALTLQAIPGPDGTVPFRSPGGGGPVQVISPPGDTDDSQVYVVTQDGYIYVINHGVLQTTPFLDLHAKTDTTDDGGLFSMAFAPDYATSGTFYVDYSDLNGGIGSKLNQPTVVEYRRDAASGLVDESSGRVVLTVPTTGCTTMTGPHYGGQLAFGPDGKLWISVGDGGDGCSDRNRAKDLTDLHGKILRIDPAPGAGCGGGCTIPTDNPLYGAGGSYREEIWGSGLRNPWRFAFDSAAPHDLFLTDVGDKAQEEIDRVAAASAAGSGLSFFGWPCREGGTVWDPVCTRTTPFADTLVDPVFSYPHASPTTCTAIIGGQVLHDPSLPAGYDGRYLYTYFCAGLGGVDSGRLFTADAAASPLTARDEGLTVGFGPSSVSADGCGHPYVTKPSGGLWRVEGDTPGPCGEWRAPQTTIDTAPGAVTAARSASFTYSSSVRGSTFVCRLDGAPVDCGVDGLTLSGLGDGTHTLTVAARDEAGNTDPTPASATWRVSFAEPDTIITDAPPRWTQSHALTYAFASDQPDATFRCSLDFAASEPCTSPKTYDNVHEGVHTLLVTAISPNGLGDTSPAERLVAVDDTPPVTRITSRVRPKTNATTTTIEFAASENGTSTCVVDGGAPQTCTTPVTLTGLKPGPHTFSVASTDQAGNTETTPASVSWSVEPVKVTSPATVRASRTFRIGLAIAPLDQTATVRVALRRAGRDAAQRVRLRVKAGTPIALKIPLSHATRKLLRRDGRLKLSVLVNVTITLDVQTTATRALTVIAPPRR